MDLDLTAADFDASAADGLAVRVAIDGEVSTIPLAVTGVRVGTAPGPGFRDPFVVELDGPRELPLPQAVYELVHPTRGVLEVLIVAHGPTPDGRLGYSITFG